MTGGDKRNYTTLWFITNEIKRNTRSFPYFDRQTWRRSPQSFEYLEELPAVGHKTASVVMSSIPGCCFPVDTHIHRLMYRWNLTNGKMSNRKDAKRLFPEEIWNDLHLQIIWYGRNIPCTRLDLEKILLRTL
jgi:endonuclease-3